MHWLHCAHTPSPKQWQLNLPLQMIKQIGTNEEFSWKQWVIQLTQAVKTDTKPVRTMTVVNEPYITSVKDF